jgi:hypothetical protein
LFFFGFSFAWTKYPWLSIDTIALLGFSLLSWILFLLVEAKREVYDICRVNIKPRNRRTEANVYLHPFAVKTCADM